MFERERASGRQQKKNLPTSTTTTKKREVNLKTNPALKSDRTVAELLKVLSVRGEFLEPPPSFSLRSIAEEQTRLPCRFRVQDEQVVQVTWFRERPDGTKEQLITAHHVQGQPGFGKFADHLHFESSDPMADSTLIIRSTEVSDEGMYTCHISTFPSGNFERQLSLTVWTTPISSLDPVEMVEGESFRVAATCRSVARPPPRLSWDTELPGQSQNRSSESGAVTAHFSLHPLRSMNGRSLDCLVWHPALDKPRRIANRLVVLYPPNPTVRGNDGTWVVGLQGASLRCDSGGNPQPHSFTWSRRGAALPEDVIVEGGTLRFGRPLAPTDGGVYECEARNSVGAVKADTEILLESGQRQEASVNNLWPLLGGAAGALVIVLVISMAILTCYHKRKNRKLEKELNEKMEEFSTLSRQASIRRFDSINTDPRIPIDDNIPLPPESHTRTSMSSLSGPSGKRDSHSTLSMGRAERPPLYSSMRRAERDAFTQNAFTQNAPNAMDIGPSASQNPSPLPMGPGSVSVSPAPPPLKMAYSSAWGGSPTPPEDEEEEEEEEQTSSLHISEAVSHYFHYSNGVLHPKRQPHAILLHPRGQII
ncbi:nectin-4-like isoform X1 [Anguilla anguilla]|uniref:nectin-4-like isoform X1 n=1 Tax=Anguilla anguilla TaxID=7936 RepID=UPI0015AAA4F5|nr:nectin-4-like isoform X1 [Anguilla anguilla]